MIRGDSVTVRAYGGEVLTMRVWDTDEGVVYVCSEENYQKLIRNIQGLSPVGVPAEDVERIEEESNDRSLSNV